MSGYYITTCAIKGPVFGPSATLTAATANLNGFAGITFDVKNVGTAPIQISGFTAPIAAGVHPTNVYYTTSATTAVGNQSNAGAWTLLGSANVTGAGGFPTATLSAVPVGGLTLNPGEQKGIYIYTTDGNFFSYSNGDNTTTDGTLSIISAGHCGGQAPFINANCPRRFFGEVSYTTPLPGPTAVQTSGIPSGGAFPIGTTTNCFTATDGVGLTASCCFTVTVTEYPFATHVMTCDDLVQISLDETCTAVVGAGLLCSIFA